MQYNEAIEIQIGKNGVTKELLEHLKKLLKKHKLVKLKYSKKEDMSTELPGTTIKKIGKTLVIKE